MSLFALNFNVGGNLKKGDSGPEVSMPISYLSLWLYSSEHFMHKAAESAAHRAASLEQVSV